MGEKESIMMNKISSFSIKTGLVFLIFPFEKERGPDVMQCRAVSDPTVSASLVSPWPRFLKDNSG